MRRDGHTGVKGRGGLTVGMAKGDEIKIGDDITIIMQHNNSPKCKHYQIRIIAPPHLKITRSNYNEREDRPIRPEHQQRAGKFFDTPKPHGNRHPPTRCRRIK